MSWTSILPKANCIPPAKRKVYKIVETPDESIVMRTLDDNPPWYHELKEDEFSFWKMVFRNRQNYSNAGLVLYKVPESYNYIRSTEFLSKITIGTIYEQYFDPKSTDQNVTWLYGDPQLFDPPVTIDSFLSAYTKEPSHSKTFDEAILKRKGKSQAGNYPMEIEASLQNNDDEFDMRILDDMFDVLRSAGSVINGVNSPYLYIGLEDTFFPYHRENMNLQSLNLMYHLEGSDKESVKFWVGIDLRDTEAFIDLIVQESKASCWGVLQSKRFVPFHPRLLADNGIRFQIVKQTPGHIVMTMGAHGGRNSDGVTVNEAVNVIYPQFFGYNKVHASDEKLKLEVYDGCTHKDLKKGGMLHNSEDFRIQTQDHGKYGLFDKGKDLNIFVAAGELCFLKFKEELDKLNVFMFSDWDMMEKVRKRFLVSIMTLTGLIEFDKDMGVVDTWVQVRKMMEATSSIDKKWIKLDGEDEKYETLVNYPYSNHFQFFETTEESLEWAKSMTSLVMTEDKVIVDIIKFLNDKVQKTPDELFEELEKLLSPPPKDPKTITKLKRTLSVASSSSTSQTSKRTRTQESKDTTTRVTRQDVARIMDQLIPKNKSTPPQPEIEEEAQIPSPPKEPSTVMTGEGAKKRRSSRIAVKKEVVETPPVSQTQLPMDLSPIPSPPRTTPIVPPKESGKTPVRKSSRISQKIPTAVQSSSNYTVEPSVDMSTEGANRRSTRISKANEGKTVEQKKQEKVDLRKKIDEYTAFTAKLSLSTEDRSFIYQYAKSMKSDPIEEQIEALTNDPHSMSFFLIKLLSGKNRMDLTVEQAVEILEQIVKFGIDGKTVMKKDENGENVEKVIDWAKLLEPDTVDKRTSYHNEWVDLLFDKDSVFWKRKVNVLGPLSMKFYNSVAVSKRLENPENPTKERSGIKNTGPNSKKINFVVRGLLECLYLDMEGRDYPLDVEDKYYQIWKGKYNWTEGKLKLPAYLAGKIDGVEIDENWDDTVAFLKTHRQKIWNYQFDIDNHNHLSRSNKRTLNTLQKDAILLSKDMEKYDADEETDPEKDPGIIDQLAEEDKVDADADSSDSE